MFFVFKQKTAYEMRISDWSSDVCSPDLRMEPFSKRAPRAEGPQDGLQVADGVQDREVVVGRGLPVDDARPVPGDEDVAGTEVAVHQADRQADRKNGA